MLKGVVQVRVCKWPGTAPDGSGLSEDRWSRPGGAEPGGERGDAVFGYHRSWPQCHCQ